MHTTVQTLLLGYINAKFNIQKSAQDPWQIGAIFFLFSFAFSFLSLRISQIPSCRLSPVLNFLTPCLLLSIHELFFSLLILAFWLMPKLLLCLAVSFSLSPTLIPGKCRSFPDKFLKKQSLWRSSAELCQKMCGNSLDGKEKGLLIVFLFFFSSSTSGISQWKKIWICSFIYLTMKTVFNGGWQWLPVRDSIAYYSNSSTNVFKCSPCDTNYAY